MIEFGRQQFGHDDGHREIERTVVQARQRDARKPSIRLTRATGKRRRNARNASGRIVTAAAGVIAAATGRHRALRLLDVVAGALHFGDDQPRAHLQLLTERGELHAARGAHDERHAERDLQLLTAFVSAAGDTFRRRAAARMLFPRR